MRTHDITSAELVRKVTRPLRTEMEAGEPNEAYWERIRQGFPPHVYLNLLKELAESGSTRDKGLAAKLIQSCLGLDQVTVQHVLEAPSTAFKSGFLPTEADSKALGTGESEEDKDT